MRLLTWLRTLRKSERQTDDKILADPQQLPVQELEVSVEEIPDASPHAPERPDTLEVLRERLFQLEYAERKNSIDDARREGVIDGLRESVREVNEFRGRMAASITVGAAFLTISLTIAGYFLLKDITTIFEMAREFQNCHRQSPNAGDTWLCDHGIVVSDEQRARIDEILKDRGGNEVSGDNVSAQAEKKQRSAGVSRPQVREEEASVNSAETNAVVDMLPKPEATATMPVTGAAP